MTSSLTCSSNISSRYTEPWNSITLILNEWKRRKWSLSRSLKGHRFIIWHYHLNRQNSVLLSSIPSQHVEVCAVVGYRCEDNHIKSRRSLNLWNLITKYIWQRNFLHRTTSGMADNIIMVLWENNSDLLQIREIKKEYIFLKSEDGFIHCVGDQRWLWIVCFRTHISFVLKLWEHRNSLSPDLAPY